MPQLTYKNQSIPYTHVVKPRLKHAYIEIRAAQVIFKSPPMAASEVQRLILKKAPWILKKLAQCPRYPILETGNAFYLLGEKHTLHIHAACAAEDSQVFLKGKQLHLHAPETVQDPLLAAFLKEQALFFLDERITDWAEIMGLHPKKVRYKRLKSRYGSCSSLGNVNLNYLMIQLPPTIIDSVLVHELAHLKYLNHSKDFWNLVYSFVPDYKALDQELKALWQERLWGFDS